MVASPHVGQVGSRLPPGGSSGTHSSWQAGQYTRASCAGVERTALKARLSNSMLWCPPLGEATVVVITCYRGLQRAFVCEPKKKWNKRTNENERFEVCWKANLNGLLEVIETYLIANVSRIRQSVSIVRYYTVVDQHARQLTV